MCVDNLWLITPLYINPSQHIFPPHFQNFRSTKTFVPFFAFCPFTKQKCLTELTVTSGGRRRAFSSFRTISPLLCRRRSLLHRLPLKLRIHRQRKATAPAVFTCRHIHRPSRRRKCRLPIALAEDDPFSFLRRKYEIN